MMDLARYYRLSFKSLAVEASFAPFERFQWLQYLQPKTTETTQKRHKEIPIKSGKGRGE
jgi:hypothetical protein